MSEQNSSLGGGILLGMRIRRIVFTALVVATGVLGWREPSHGIGWQVQTVAKALPPQVRQVEGKITGYYSQFGEAAKAMAPPR
jgi:hypothetical protein